MKKFEQSNNLIQKVQSLLKSIGDINYIITDNSLVFKKDNCIFGKIFKENVYLLDSSSSFQ